MGLCDKSVCPPGKKAWLLNTKWIVFYATGDLTPDTYSTYCFAHLQNPSCALTDSTWDDNSVLSLTVRYVITSFYCVQIIRVSRFLPLFLRTFWVRTTYVSTYVRKGTFLLCCDGSLLTWLKMGLMTWYTLLSSYVRTSPLKICLVQA